MLMLLLLPVLLGSAQAQYTTMCECAIFNTMQLDPDLVQFPMPLEYMGSSDIDEGECDKDVEEVNACMVKCQTEFQDRGGDTLMLCDDNNDQTPRCTGSEWCEALHNSGIPNVQKGDGVNRLFYKMIQCDEGSPYREWRYGFRDIADDGLCCSDGLFSHCDSPCEGGCAALNLCECGAFIDAQFEVVEGTNPLSIHNIGAEWGPPSEGNCANWPGPEFGHLCDSLCLLSSQYFKSNVALNEPSTKNPELTYGQYYCKALKARWDDVWPEGGIGPHTITTYARMPQCDPEDGTTDHLKWNRNRPYTCHHQALCCDGDGNRYTCEHVNE